MTQAIAKTGREIGSFEFDATITKAYERDGEMHVVAVPSDTLRDDQGDRVSKAGIGGLAGQCQDGIDILDNHRATFPFGRTTGDSRTQARKGGGHDLVVDILLDKSYPQSLALFKEVQDGTCEKQLSIGGKLNRANPDCIRYEKDSSGVKTRVIEDLNLDHIACTRKMKAANKRTTFLDAVMKAVDEVEAERGDIEKEGDDMGEPTTVKKKAVPFKKYPAYQGTSWNWGAAAGNALIDKGGWPMFKAAHAWFNDAEGETPESKAAYKLPHHIIEGGRMVTHFPGTSYAMAALLGARGGTVIPRGEKQATYNHLAGHYRDAGADKEIPEFRFAGKVVTTKGEEVEEFKGNLSEVDFEKTEVEPWTREDFVKFHKEQEMDVEWLTEEVWDSATKDLSEEHHKEVEAAWEKEKSEMEKANAEAKAGFSFLRKIGKALGMGTEEETKDLELVDDVESLVKSIQALEADAEKGGFTDKDRVGLNRGLSLVEVSLEKIAKTADLDPILDLSVDNETVKAMLEKGGDMLSLVDKKFTKDDVTALNTLHGALEAMATKPDAEKGGGDGDDVTKEIPEDVFSDIVEKAMIVHRQLLTEKVEAIQGIANEIAEGAANMTAAELQAKVSQMSEISWDIRDVAVVVNATRSAMTNKDDGEADDKGGDEGDAEKGSKDGDDKGDVKDDTLKALEENATSTVEWLKGLEKDKSKEYTDRIQAVIKSLTNAISQEKGKEGDETGGEGGKDKGSGGKGEDDAKKDKGGDEISKELLDGEIKKANETLKGEIVKEITATLKDATVGISKELEGKVVGAIEKVKEVLDAQGERLEKMEKVSGVRQGIAGSDDVAKGSGGKKGDVWTGLFDSAMGKATSKM